MLNGLMETSIPERHHELLNVEKLGMLTTVRQDGLLSTNPVGFRFDGARIRISTLKSRLKYRNIRHDPRIAFCVLSSTEQMYYVEIRGYATLADDADRSYFRQQFRELSGQEPPEDLDPPGEERVVITLHPASVSSPTLYGGRFHNKPANVPD
jgi:PPOX class probable F420-dependent enzyme